MPHRKRFIAAALFFTLVVLTPSCRNQSSEMGEAIDASEPEAYRATVFFSYLPGGNRGVQPNPLFTLDIARRGSERRYTFHFDNDEVSYLEGVNQHYLIATGCRQYVEATLEQLNFRLPGSMELEEIISKLRRAHSFRRAGEEQVDGRTAIKYLGAEKTILIDQATGLPLRVELVSKIGSPNADGKHGQIHLIIEMRDIKTDADAALFQSPKDYREVKPQELCPQINQLAQSAMQKLWSISTKEDQPANL